MSGKGTEMYHAVLGDRYARLAVWASADREDGVSGSDSGVAGLGVDAISDLVDVG